MSKDEEFKLLVRNLETINELKLYDKISINKNVLSINKYSLCRPMKRMYSGQNRENLYLYLIKIIDDIVRHLEYFVEYKSLKCQEGRNIPKISSFDKYLEIQRKYLNIKNIVDILGKTYESDKEYCRKLYLLKERIDKTDPNFYTYYLINEKSTLSTIEENKKLRYSNSF
tara:strand:+ start:42 stop:551 length:510 start_codon:yes stop_codon:yes gene_type:complete